MAVISCYRADPNSFEAVGKIILMVQPIANDYLKYLLKVIYFKTPYWIIPYTADEARNIILAVQYTY